MLSPFMKNLMIYSGIMLGLMSIFLLLVTLSHGSVTVLALAVLAVAAVVMVKAQRHISLTLGMNSMRTWLFHLLSFVVIVGTVGLYEVAAGFVGTMMGGLAWLVIGWGVGLVIHTVGMIADRTSGSIA